MICVVFPGELICFLVMAFIKVLESLLFDYRVFAVMGKDRYVPPRRTVFSLSQSSRIKSGSILWSSHLVPLITDALLLFCPKSLQHTYKSGLIDVQKCFSILWDSCKLYIGLLFFLILICGILRTLIILTSRIKNCNTLFIETKLPDEKWQ